jgi:hypothetical protein
MVVVEIPGLRLPNLSNARIHWRTRAKLVREQREEVTYALIEAPWHLTTKPTAEAPWLVTLWRSGPSVLDDDGVVTSCKGVRDAIAAFLGVNDRDRHIVRYAYEQETGPFGLRIEITQRQTEML